jgi:hypothetical protein
MYTGPPYIENIEITNKQVDDHPKQPRMEKSGFLHLTIERSSCQPSLEEDWVYSRIQRHGSNGS